MSKKPKLLVILGPTASGKSALAVNIAKKFGGEVISADSRQVYKDMHIGTGKVTKKEMAGVPHHMLSVLSPKRTFNAGLFQERARGELDKILARKKLPIICGGTGFYIDTLIYDYNLPDVPRDVLLRKKLERESTVELFSRLKKLDPERAETIDPHNRVRLIRSLEVVMKTKRPLPRLQKQSRYEILKLGIRLEDGDLKNKIHSRLLSRVKQGMIQEVKGLKRNGVSRKRFEDLGLEYRFVNRFLEGDITKQQMVEILEKEIWQYARRQMTWFKRDHEINWIKNEKEAEQLVSGFLR